MVLTNQVLGGEKRAMLVYVFHIIGSAHCDPA